MDRAVPKEVEVVLDRTSPIPLYHQLATAIERAISDGMLAPGDRLENELSMTRRLGLARPTARQAIQELTNKGLVVRKRGVGTQVLHSQISRETKLTSLYDDLARAGRKPSTELLEFGRVTAEAENLTSFEGVGELIKIRRLRYADSSPLAILTNFLPASFDLTEAELTGNGLYACLRTRGVQLRAAHQRIGARLMSIEEAQLLGEQGPAACLTVERTGYDETGRCVEVGRHVYRASHYTMEVSLVP